MKHPRIETVQTRLRSSNRGFYTDPDPGFKGFREALDRVKAHSGNIKMAAVYSVLAKFALLDEQGDPIIELTRIIKDDDFGYTKRRANRPTRMADEKPVWSPNSPLGSGWTADALGAISNESYGGV